MKWDMPIRPIKSGPLMDREINELHRFLLTEDGLEHPMDLYTFDGFICAVLSGPNTMIRAGTAASVTASLFERRQKLAHADPDVRAKLEAQGFDMSGQSGPEFEADIRAQIERWSHLVKGAGFKAD